MDEGSETSDLTELLRRWRANTPGAEEALMRAVYPRLRVLAGAQLARAPGTLTLQPTELVNECYLRIARARDLKWSDRNHFFAVSAKVMRRFIVDLLRRKGAKRRGGRIPFRIEADQVADARWSEPVDWLAVDEALTRLESHDEQCARIVELKLFGGLTVDEIGGVLNCSEATVRRRWRFARTWLATSLEGPDRSTEIRR